MMCSNSSRTLVDLFLLHWPLPPATPELAGVSAYITMSLQKLPCLLLVNATATASGTCCCCT